MTVLDLEDLAETLGPVVVEAAGRQAFRRAWSLDRALLERVLGPTTCRLVEHGQPWPHNFALAMLSDLQRALPPDHHLVRLLKGWAHPRLSHSSPDPLAALTDMCKPEHYSLSAADVAGIMEDLDRLEASAARRRGVDAAPAAPPGHTAPRVYIILDRGVPVGWRWTYEAAQRQAQKRAGEQHVSLDKVHVIAVDADRGA